MHGKLHFRTIKIFLKYFSKKYASKPTTNLNLIRCNFVIFGAIFMKFSPKCNSKSDIGKFVTKFVTKFGDFCLYLGEKQGPITGPKFALGKSLYGQIIVGHCLSDIYGQA